MNYNEEKIAMDFWGRFEYLQSLKNTSLKTICDKNGIHYRTTLNQKSCARLPSLITAFLLAKEVDSTVEWLLFGSEPEYDIESSEQLARTIFNDKRLLSISKKLINLSQEELFSLEVLLKIRT